MYQDNRRPSLVVAVAENGVIGNGDELPWKLSTDLKRFKRLTIGNCLLMGRKTFESIGRVLPGRTTIVMSRQQDWSFPGVHLTRSLDEAWDFVPEDQTLFVVGGAEIYKTCLPACDTIHFTHVLASVEGDVRFPDWDKSKWRSVYREPFSASDRDQWPTLYEIFVRNLPDSTSQTAN